MILTPALPFRLSLCRLSILVFSIPLSFILSACKETTRSYYQGYAEAEFTYVSSPLGGTLTHLAVQKGQEVEEQALLFRLDSVPETAAKKEAENRLNQARARLANMEKGLRPSEIKGIEARLAQATSALNLSRLEYKRHEKLYGDHAISKSTMDRVRTQYKSDQDRVKELTAQLETARLGARSDEIRAAKDEVAAVEARLQQADWSLEQKTQNAPRAGLVFDTFYNEGEWVPPSRPVVSLLVPEELKVRYFVPETELSQWKLNQEVALHCDGCPKGLTAKVTYISPQVEFTPPVIYSKDTRSKLVTMIEARPEPVANGFSLHPGQPMEVFRTSTDMRANASP